MAVSSPMLPRSMEPFQTSGSAAVRTWSSGHRGWVERSFSVVILVGGLGSLVMAWRQLNLLDPWWLVTIGGGIAATSLLAPLYAWSTRGIRVPFTVLAVLVLVGVWTWPAAWRGADEPAMPFLWLMMCGMTLAVSLAWGNLAAILTNVAAAAGYVVALLSPAGGAAVPVVALQEVVWVTVLPLALLALSRYTRQLAAELDGWIDVSRRAEDDAALRAALTNERAHLDAVIHDEVMTTLVAAGRAVPGHDLHLAEQARSALASLDAESGEDAAAESFAPGTIAGLIADVLEAACPTATFEADVDPLVPSLPRAVVSCLVRAVREAAYNAERHAQAEQVAVRLRIGDDDGTVRIDVEVADDGRGFDVAAVSSRRLGLLVSVRSNMEALGGVATVRSAPGEGTTVSLHWSGAAFVQPPTPGSTPRDVATFDRLNLRPLAWVVLAGMSIPIMVGVLEVFVTSRPWDMLGLVVLIAATGWLPLGAPWRPFGRIATPLSNVRVALTMVACVAIAVAGIRVLVLVGWSVQPVWWAHAITYAGMLLRVRGRRVWGWVAAVLSSLSMLVAVLLAGGDPWLLGPTLVLPLTWLIGVEMAMSWLGRVRRSTSRARLAAEQASHESAASFGKLVLREVWLADLRALVDPLLLRIADPSVELTEAEREQCLLLEGQLRDDIKSANLVAPSVSAQISEARRRGVEVVLIDNRGSMLPLHVRRVGLRYLEDVVRSANDGRIVARTAPQGYDEALTIVRVDKSGTTTLVKIGNDGTIRTM